MAQFENEDGSLLALGAVAIIGFAAGLAGKGSRATSPRQLARNKRGQAHRDARDGVPERERILANARKYTYADYVAGWRTRGLIALKDELTEDDKDELQRLNMKWGYDSPYAQPAEVKVTLMGEGIPHLHEYVQDWLWDLHWWAVYRGKTLDEYLDTCDLWGPLTRAAVHASPPMPEGYIVSTRRQGR